MAYTWERRQELARARGWAGATEQAKAIKFAKESTEFSRLTGIDKRDIRADKLALLPDVKGQSGHGVVQLYYQAFKQGDPDDYTLRTRNGRPVVRQVDGKPEGARAKWLIDIANYVDDSQEWRRRYPNGVRDGITSATTVERVLSFGGD